MDVNFDFSNWAVDDVLDFVIVDEASEPPRSWLLDDMAAVDGVLGFGRAW